jgi:hypothetical protein
MLDTTIVKGPGLDVASGTRVAAGYGINLVVWVDFLSLRGARVNAAGALLDSLPMDIDGPDLEAFENMRPQVAWSGGTFLVAWSSYERTMFALVGPDSQVTMRKVLQDSVHALQNAGTAVGFDGTNFLVAWPASTSEGRVVAFFARITPEGTVLDSPPRLVVPGNDHGQHDIAVGFHGNRYLAAWVDFDANDEIWGTFILPDGSATDSVGFAIHHGASADFPAVTHDARNFIVAWTEAGNHILLARVTDEGLVLDSTGVLVDSTTNGRCDLVSAGDTTMVMFCSDSLGYKESLSVVAVRLDTALRRLDSVPLVIEPPGPGSEGGYYPSDPSVAFAGYGYVVAWCKPFTIDSTPHNTNAVFLRLDRQGHIVDTAAIIVSCGTNSHTYPDVASDGADFLSVWIDSRHDSIQRSEAVCGMRFSQDGTRLDPAGFRISPPGATRPALAFGAGCYLVCWSHDGDIFGARVQPNGILQDSVPIALEHDSARTASYPDVAFGDSSFLVAWHAGNMVYGVRVRPDGVVADTAPRALQAYLLRDARYPQVGFDGRNFLVVRKERADHDFHAARVSTAGELLDTTDIVFGAYTPSSSPPRVAFGNGVYMVVDGQRGGAWRVSPNGEVLGSVPYSYHDRAQVVFDGTNFMLLCERESNNELGAIRITPDGQVLDSAPFLLVTTQSASASVLYAAMAANSSGRIGLVSRCKESLPYLASRIRGAAFPAVGIDAEREGAQFAPFRALPNPASRMVSLSFGLRQAGPVQVSAFDAAGRRCAVVHSGKMPAGAHRLSYDTRRLPNGVYFLRFEAGADTRSARLVVSH